jgi:hypothetical protein
LSHPPLRGRCGTGSHTTQTLLKQSPRRPQLALILQRESELRTRGERHRVVVAEGVHRALHDPLGRRAESDKVSQKALRVRQVAQRRQGQATVETFRLRSPCDDLIQESLRAV